MAKNHTPGKFLKLKVWIFIYEEFMYYITCKVLCHSK